MTKEQKRKRTAEVRRRAAGGMRPPPRVEPPEVKITPRLLRAAELIDGHAFNSKFKPGDVGYDAILARQKLAIDTADTIRQIFRGEA